MYKNPKPNELIRLAKDVCVEIIASSIYWSGEDEEKHPGLKKARTLAGLYIERHKEFEKIQRSKEPVTKWMCCGVLKPIDRRCSCGQTSD